MRRKGDGAVTQPGLRQALKTWPSQPELFPQIAPQYPVFPDPGTLSAFP